MHSIVGLGLVVTVPLLAIVQKKSAHSSGVHSARDLQYLLPHHYYSKSPYIARPPSSPVPAGPPTQPPTLRRSGSSEASSSLMQSRAKTSRSLSSTEIIFYTCPPPQKKKKASSGLEALQVSIYATAKTNKRGDLGGGGKQRERERIFFF